MAQSPNSGATGMRKTVQVSEDRLRSFSARCVARNATLEVGYDTAATHLNRTSPLGGSSKTGFDGSAARFRRWDPGFVSR